MPSLSLYILFWPSWGLFTYIGVFKTWPNKKDMHHFWRLHPPLRYALCGGPKTWYQRKFSNSRVNLNPQNGWLATALYQYSQFLPIFTTFSWPFWPLLTLKWPLSIDESEHVHFKKVQVKILHIWIFHLWKLVMHNVKYDRKCYQNPYSSGS